MITRGTARIILAMSGFAILAGNAFTYWSRGAYEIIPVIIGLVILLSAVFLRWKKQKK